MSETDSADFEKIDDAIKWLVIVWLILDLIICLSIWVFR